MQALRSSTREHHLRAEDAVDLSSRLGSPASYVGLLSVFSAFLQSVELMIVDVVASSPAELRGGLQRRRARLDADLRTLGETHVWEGGATFAPRISGLDEQLGAWYVIEGSALGGTVIARAVQIALPELKTATTFFTGDGPRTAERWRAFSAFVNWQGGRGVDCDAAQTGAEKAFACLIAIATHRCR